MSWNFTSSLFTSWRFVSWLFTSWLYTSWLFTSWLFTSCLFTSWLLRRDFSRCDFSCRDFSLFCRLCRHVIKKGDASSTNTCVAQQKCTFILTSSTSWKFLRLAQNLFANPNAVFSCLFPCLSLVRLGLYLPLLRHVSAVSQRISAGNKKTTPLIFQLFRSLISTISYKTFKFNVALLVLNHTHMSLKWFITLWIICVDIDSKSRHVRE